MSGLTSADYWTERHPEVREHILGDQPHNVEHLFPVLDRYLGDAAGGTLFEFGCVPGQGLVKVARRYGLVPNGSDFSAQLPVTEKVIREEFTGARFFEHDIGAEDVTRLGSYDVVMSGGLIEHFDDVRSVIAKHAAVVRPGGLVVLSTPNLEPRRAAWWRAFDPGLLRAHNPRATDVRAVAGTLDELGLEVLASGYFGDPHVWIENSAGLRGRAGQKLTAAVNRGLALTGLRRPATMPFVFWVARRGA